MKKRDQGKLDELGVRRQETICREMAQARGWVVVEVYEDNNASAWSLKPRPAYLRMLDDIRSGRINTVMASAADRLTRNSEEQIAFLRLAADTGFVCVTGTGGELDMATAGGRLLAKMQADIGEYESDIKSQRQAHKMAELRAAGKFTGGRRAFGLTQGYTALVPEEVVLIREAAADVIAGVSLRRITRDWNAQGIRTAAGREWDITKLKAVLISNWARGLGRDGTPAVWPAILQDKVVNTRLDLILKDPTRGSRRPEVSRHLLTGLMFCNKDDTGLTSSKNNGKRAYSCRRCHRRVLAEGSETDIVIRVMVRIDNLTVGNKLARNLSPTADEAELEVLDHEEAEIDALLGDGTMKPVNYVRAMERLAARRDAVTARLRLDAEEEQRRAQQAASFDLIATWDKLDLDQRRGVLSAFIDRIGVGPATPGARAFDKRRLSVTWR